MSAISTKRSDARDDILQEPPRFRFLISVCAVVVASTGLMALLGWILGIPYLASLGSGRIPVAPSTAVLFVLYSVAIFLHARMPSLNITRWIGLAINSAGAIAALLLFVLSYRGIYPSAEHLGFTIVDTPGQMAIGHMSPVTAFCFLLVSLSFLASHSSSFSRPLLATIAWFFASILIAIGMLLVMAYLFGTPLIYGGAFIPPAALTSIAILTLGVALFHLAIRRALLFQPDAEPGAHNWYFLIVLFVLLVCGIVSTGYLYYRNYEKQYRAEMEAQISAIADLKVGELAQWRKERLGDAAVIFDNETFSGLVENYLGNPSDTEAREKVFAWLSRVKKGYDYDRVSLLDAQGVQRISIPDTAEPVDSHLKNNFLTIMQSRRPSFLDFYRNARDKRIYLSVLAPILNEQSGAAIGLIVLRIDPEKQLYPIFNRWLTTSESAETLLVRRDGNDALFLNNIRFQKDSALNLRIPLDKTNVPAVKAVLGEEGIVEGNDYRAVKVIAFVHAVPDSPWFLVARIDKSEVYAPLRERLWGLIILLGALLIGVGAGVGFIWRRQSAQFYREKFEAAEALLKSEERYGATLMSVGDGVIATDAEGRVEIVNPVAAALTGWPQNEAQGRPLEEIFHIINEETRNSVENPVRKVVRDGMVIGLANHTLLMARDGAERAIADSGAPIRNKDREITGVVLVFRDQSKEREAQKALAESESRFREMANSLPHLVWTFRPNGLCDFLSQQWIAYTGIPESNQLGSRWLEQIHPEDRDRTVAAWQAAIDSGSDFFTEFRIRRHDGAYRTFDARVVPLRDAQGHVVKWLGSNTDISERKQAEEARHEAEQKLEKQRALSIQSDRLRALGEMATGIAHELNQPLVGVRGLSEHIVLGMKRGWFPENKDIMEKSQLIIEQVERMTHIIEHIRGFVKGSVGGSSAPTQVNDVVNSGLALMQAQMRSRGLILKINLAEGLPPVMANPFSLEEVVFNLLGNGRDAMLEKMERGGVEEPVIAISTFLDGGNEKKEVVLKVVDHGIGIPPEVMDKIFDPFFTTKEVGKGTGIGLPISKSIIESIGGTITIESEPGTGTTAIVRLPAIVKPASR